MVKMNRIKLRDAIAGAKGLLSIEEEKNKPRSSIARLISKQVSDNREKTLVQRSVSVNRPSIQIISNRVLGEDVEPFENPIIETTGVSSVVSERLKSMRKRNLEAAEEQSLIMGENDDGLLGIESDGTPVWQSVLDVQRGYAINQFSEDIAPIRKRGEYDWPTQLIPSGNNTFKQWDVIAENSRATAACERIIDRPGGDLNPLLITGTAGCGRSHLLHATSQAMLLRQEGGIHLIHCRNLAGNTRLPSNDWREALPEATLLAFDDIDTIAGEEQLAAELADMIDIALNHGVQILLSSSTSIDDWPSSRLWEICSGAVNIALDPPSRAGLISHLRRRTSSRGNLLSDAQLAALHDGSGFGWRGVKAGFEKIMLAMDSGDVVLDAEDVLTILEDRRLSPVRTGHHNPQTIESLAQKIVGEALDEVYTTSDPTGVEVHTELPELEDDWRATVPELTTPESSVAAAIGKDPSEITPHLDSALTYDEADEHLVRTTDEIEIADLVKADEMVADILESTDVALEDSIERAIQERSRLGRIDAEMTRLPQQARAADLEELVDITDRFKLLRSQVDGLPMQEELEEEIEEDMENTKLARFTPLYILQPGEEE